MGAQLTSLKEITRTKQAINQASQAETTVLPDPNTETVMKKLRALKECRDMGENELQELAEALSDKDKFKERFFDRLVRGADHAVRNALDDAQAFAGRDIPNEITRADSQDRMQTGYNHVCSIKVELLLFELREEYFKQDIARFFHRYVRECSYGPFHAALKVGNLILDWDESSLVIPYTADTAAISRTGVLNRTLVFRGNLHKTGLASPTEVTVPIRGGADRTGAAFNEQLNHLLDITDEKACLLDTLADLMVWFNKKQRYGLLSNNCQHFVKEVLSRLGDTQADLFDGRIREFFNTILVERNKKGQESEFNTHAELDEHVRENIGEMSPHDLEFCHCHYLLFHAWSQKFRKPAWRCEPGQCQADLIAAKIGR